MSELPERQRPPNWQHGLTSEFARVGDETTLNTAQRSRLLEIRAELAAPNGVPDALLKHAADVTLVHEWAMSWLRETAEREGAAAAFAKPMMVRFFTSAAEKRRTLETLARVLGKGDGSPSAADTDKLVEHYRNADAGDR